MSSLHLFLSFALQGAIFSGAALLGGWLLAKRSARARRKLLVLSFALTLVAPLLGPVGRGLVAERPVVARSTSAAPSVPDTEPVVEAIERRARAGGAAAATPVDAPAAARAEGAVERAPSAGLLPIALLALWLLGSIAVGTRFARAHLAARAIARRALPISDPIVLRALVRAERAVGARAVVAASDEVDAPMLIGALRPVIVLPESARGWPAARLERVLAHELAHARSADVAANILAQLVVSLSFFDPIAWRALRKLEEERELAADELVVAAGARASDYAEDLLVLASSLGQRRTAGAIGAVPERSHVATRIEAVLDGARPALGARGAVGVAASAAALLALGACVGPSIEPAPRRVDAKAASGPGRIDAAPRAAARSGRSTIEPRVQALATRELERAKAEYGADDATAIVLDARTGRVLAMVGERLATTPREPGSTIKPLLVAGALEQGVIRETETIDCEHGERVYPTGQRLRDIGDFGSLDVAGILAVSSNVGASKIFDRLGGDAYVDTLRGFGFDRAIRAGDEQAQAFSLGATPKAGTIAGANAALGHGVRVTPLHMAAAYAALANGGVYASPSSDDGAPVTSRAVRADTARAVLGLLEKAVTAPASTGAGALVAGVRVGGKTGTAQIAGRSEVYYGSFVGVAPIDAPKYVVLVGMIAQAPGGKSSAPVFSRIVASLEGG